MFYFSGKKPAEWVLIKADFFFRAGKAREQAGGRKALHIDDRIVFIRANFL
jgi:hypothetical protein